MSEEKKLIYLDNAATTRTSPEVVQEMLPFFSEYYGNPFLHAEGGDAFANKIFIHKRASFLYIVVIMSIRKRKIIQSF